jgi:AraC family transcriptional activator of pobA
MNTYPVLNINQFDTSFHESDFYSNVFSIHLSSFHSAVTIPHKHDFYLIVLFTHGKGKHEVDFTEYPIRPGVLYFIKPGQTHHWTFSEQPEGYIFFHSKEFYRMLHPTNNIEDYPMFFSGQNPPLLDLNACERLPVINKLMQTIYLEYTGDEFLKRKRIGLLIDLLYIETAREIRSRANPDIVRSAKNEFRIQQLEMLIDQNYLTLKKASDYAELLNITTKHLNKIVTTALGKTTTDLIQERILLEAKRILIRQDMTVQETAFELGFEDPAYFSRLFRKKCGVSPKDFALKYINS